VDSLSRGQVERRQTTMVAGNASQLRGIAANQRDKVYFFDSATSPDTSLPSFRDVIGISNSSTFVFPSAPV
jgi:hypothetical protein